MYNQVKYALQQSEGASYPKGKAHVSVRTNDGRRVHFKGGNVGRNWMRPGISTLGAPRQLLMAKMKSYGW